MAFAGRNPSRRLREGGIPSAVLDSSPGLRFERGVRICERGLESQRGLGEQGSCFCLDRSQVLDNSGILDSMRGLGFDEGLGFEKGFWIRKKVFASSKGSWIRKLILTFSKLIPELIIKFIRYVFET